MQQVCARCGAPLPAIAVDPTHPEWCAACAARAAGAPAAPPTVPPRPAARTAPPTTMAAGTPTVRLRLGDGLLVGAAAAALGGLAFWAIATFTEVEQWQYAAVVVGLLTGTGVALGARLPSLGGAVLAVLLSSIATVVAVYFISRSLTIIAAEDAGIATDIPLWSGWSDASDTIRGLVESDAAYAIGWALAPVAAALTSTLLRFGGRR